ncbi:hypothetical protein GHK03_16915 [Sinorhizobium medicae]|uniref:hypothetical protein n=1 Tax=Sinorhizobium medicae TaxID=110321 RepID=UPI001295581F|nr:hypothetical protein [Sinorhizobium medicae]MQX97768.1 hypothetical protein [Sinorhizobium medicae]
MLKAGEVDVVRAVNRRLFLGFGSVLIGIGADQLNRLCPLDRLFSRPSVLEPFSSA